MERIIEVPVEWVVRKEKNVEFFVEKPYEVIKENVIFNEKVIDIDEKDIANYPNA